MSSYAEENACAQTRQANTCMMLMQVNLYLSPSHLARFILLLFTSIIGVPVIYSVCLLDDMAGFICLFKLIISRTNAILLR